MSSAKGLSVYLIKLNVWCKYVSVLLNEDWLIPLPKILLKSGDIWSFNDGCLSIPDVREDVKRVSEVTLEYYDENFIKNTESFSALNARVILHEYDHIDGILFIDKITPLRKRMIKGKLKDISNGTLNANYLIRSFK